MDEYRLLSINAYPKGVSWISDAQIPASHRDTPVLIEGDTGISLGEGDQDAWAREND